MPDETSQPEKKIIVDEDWKSRVEAEREALREGPAGAKPAQEPPLPPASLSTLAATLYLQAAVALGLLPHPISGKPEPRLAQAKHTIDTLEVIREKTEGHRTPQETAEIEGLLHQLRLAYLEVARAAPSPPASPSGKIIEQG